MSFWTLKKRREKRRLILLITKSYSQSFYLHNLNSLPCSVYTLKIEYNVSLFVVPNLLKELLNMVYQKGQSCDLCSSASILMTYLYIYHQTLQNVICSHMTEHFKQQVKVLKTSERGKCGYSVPAATWEY